MMAAATAMAIRMEEEHEERFEWHGQHELRTHRRRPRWCLLRVLELCPLLLLTCSPGDHARARYDATSSVMLLSLGALGGAGAQETGGKPTPAWESAVACRRPDAAGCYHSARRRVDTPLTCR